MSSHPWATLSPSAVFQLFAFCDHAEIQTDKSIGIVLASSANSKAAARVNRFYIDPVNPRIVFTYQGVSFVR